MRRDLYLHEVIDVVGQHAWNYMEHTKGQSGHEKVGFELLGTWYVMGMTGRWPQVVNIWEIPGGWDGWHGKVDRLNLKRRSNAPLHAWWEQAFRYRSGGYDRLLGSVPGSRSMAQLTADGVRGTLFVHELTQVRPGAALDYLDAVRAEWVPLAREHGHEPVGLWEVLLHDTEVCTVWATDVDAHVALARAHDAARGIATPGVEPDPRLAAWLHRRRELCTGHREELMTPARGTLLGPPA